MIWTLFDKVKVYFPLETWLAGWLTDSLILNAKCELQTILFNVKIYHIVWIVVNHEQFVMCTSWIWANCSIIRKKKMFWMHKHFTTVTIQNQILRFCHIVTDKWNGKQSPLYFGSSSTTTTATAFSSTAFNMNERRKFIQTFHEQWTLMIFESI